MKITKENDYTTYTWDELMNTIEEIEKTESSYHGGFNVIIVNDSCSIQGKNRGKESVYSKTYAVSNNKKKAVYESILLFQEWLNNNTKKD